MPNISELISSKDEIISLYLNGNSMSKVGRKFNTSNTTVRRWLSRWGVEIRPNDRAPLKFTQEDVNLMVECYRDGFTAVQIGRLFEASDPTIRRRLKENGIILKVNKNSFKPGDQHPQWKGGRIVTEDHVSIYVTDDDVMSSMRDRIGYVREHRLKVARLIGRPLTRDETVHHIDGDSLNNDLENLQLRSNAHGQGQVRRCGDCGSINILCEEL